VLQGNAPRKRSETVRTQTTVLRANILHIDVPGPHPSLALLLKTGFRITYVETFVSSSPTPFFDPQCYIASRSDLL
jgi:hypothetical protein